MLTRGRCWLQEEQQKSVKLHQENQKLKAALRPRNDPSMPAVERLKSDYVNPVSYTHLTLPTTPYV